ncbi:sensor histidine kinase [Alicyclobacillus mengziensis]|uniref:histidine kinase n=1 Tax=Alicyclobacillus mengziensis TaxID=2931921 RepID=A0A9X7VXJ1_9BACL|nr:HAMP domain-containing sensor histidine kinase [Alicyclobacillus mengziensis]QSO46469.1 HAMP domain-containing histidine kinase [Alicyclobacillus mengziensis]
MNKSAAVSEHRLLNRIQLHLILLYLAAFLVFETVVIGVTYVILSHEIMKPMYQSIVDEWTNKTPEAIHQLNSYQEEQKQESDASAESVASWVISPTGVVIAKDTVLTSSPELDLQPLALSLSRSVQGGSTPVWGTHIINETYILAAAKPLYQGNRFIGTLVSFRSLSVIHETMEALTHIDIEIGLASLLLVVPVTYLLAHRSLTPVRSAMQRQRNFVNDAAHELRTPLTILHGTLELAQLETELANVQQAVRDGITETEYITELVGNLSTLARMESGVTELNIRKVDVAAMTRDTIAALQPIADKQNVRLIGDGFPDPAVVDGDGTRLRQLLVILVDNALKYTPAGGSVHVGIQKHRSEVELRISDSGIGIPEQDLPYIFDRFYRAVQAEQKAHGSGIGLAIAAWIVQSHRGQILVQSREEHGTTIRIVLPLQGHGFTWKKVLHPNKQI